MEVSEWAADRSIITNQSPSLCAPPSFLAPPLPVPMRVCVVLSPLIVCRVWVQWAWWGAGAEEQKHSDKRKNALTPNKIRKVEVDATEKECAVFAGRVFWLLVVLLLRADH